MLVGAMLACLLLYSPHGLLAGLWLADTLHGSKVSGQTYLSKPADLVALPK